MICTEKGVLPGSQYFFFSPSESFLEHHYGVTNCGYFQCRFGYHIEREGNRFPIIIYVIDGDISFDYGNEHYVAHKGELVLIDCSKPHKYYVELACNFYYFHFTGNSAYEVTNQFTLTELASHVNISDYYFDHQFKKETGISPVEFAAQTKINYAKMILKSTDNSISQITYLLGYSSIGSFINAFKRRVGISPALSNEYNGYCVSIL